MNIEILLTNLEDVLEIRRKRKGVIFRESQQNLDRQEHLAKGMFEINLKAFIAKTILEIENVKK